MPNCSLLALLLSLLTLIDLEVNSLKWWCQTFQCPSSLLRNGRTSINQIVKSVMRFAMCSIDASLTLRQEIFLKDPVCLLNAISCKQRTLKQKILLKEPITIIEIEFLNTKLKQWISNRLLVLQKCFKLVVYDKVESQRSKTFWKIHHFKSTILHQRK